jgi:hypothetical protein
MAATLTGTPTAINWGSGTSPTPQDVTVPADATAVYFFWWYYSGEGLEALTSVTLGGTAVSQSFSIPRAGFTGACGVSAWYSHATGTQSVAPTFADTVGSIGPGSFVAYVKDGDVTAWRDADAAHADGGTAVTVTLTSVSGDLVLKMDGQLTGAVPSTSASWTSAQTQAYNGASSKLSYIAASGSTQACDAEDENYSSVVGISIPAAAGSSIAAVSRYYAMMRSNN